jgi:hypothetical protein
MANGHADGGRDLVQMVLALDYLVDALLSGLRVALFYGGRHIRPINGF